ncbi:MAG: Spx/MgsR family RNA polymerase-binding regulatory protein [Elainella sp. Prado103]|nr:Spx/MgsR family RNA polymerase-binding regulatory protein [Elainella sp. Prado103]
MAMKVYGIPTCGTCKKALQWLKAHQIDYEFINTKEQPPDRERIRDWVESLGAKPLRNTSGQAYRALNNHQNWTDEQWIDAFAENAMLLKRPLFVQGDRAIAVGFKEAVLQEIFGL